MNCINLTLGQRYCEVATGRRYFQKLIFINKNDVKEHLVLPMGLIRFKLRTGKSGILFEGKESDLHFRPSVSQVTVDGIPNYIHSIEIPVWGISVQTKQILKELVSADYFCAIMFIDGTIEIYGFHNLLRSQDYDYSVQTEGGEIITLATPNGNEEDSLPYIYTSSDPVGDFEDLFQNVEDPVLGDFNNDFNNDFYI